MPLQAQGQLPNDSIVSLGQKQVLAARGRETDRQTTRDSMQQYRARQETHVVQLHENLVIVTEQHTREQLHTCSRAVHHRSFVSQLVTVEYDWTIIITTQLRLSSLSPSPPIIPPQVNRGAIGSAQSGSTTQSSRWLHFELHFQFRAQLLRSNGSSQD